MKNFLLLTFFTIIISSFLFAQKDTVEVPDVYDSGGQEGTLNEAVTTAMNNGVLSNTVFKLKPYGLYILTGAITTPQGQILEIAAPDPGTTQQTSPPMIAWTASAAPDKRYNFDIAGEVKMKNVWILYGSTDGTQTGSSIRVGDSATVSGGRAEFDNVIFDYAPCPGNASGAVEIYATHFKGIFKNCYFRNCIDQHLRYYGRALSFRYSSTGLHADSVMFENCTFANMGYVYMQEGAEYADNVHFNHCTFYNIVMFTLESGWWWKMSVTNSLFVNTYMFGRIPVNDGEGFGGTINIAPIDSFNFVVPFTENDRHIVFANNSYWIDQWLSDWMRDNPYSKDLKKQRRDDEIPLPQPIINGDTRSFFDSVDTGGNKVFPYINMADIDSMDPGFINPPLALDSTKIYLWYKWWNNADCNWAYNIDGMKDQIWPVVENMAYSNAELKTAAMGGFPLGDLHRWWPEEYKAWKAQETAEHTFIFNWLETGTTTDVKTRSGIPAEYLLGQNYPNPFNPSTSIEYSVPKSGYVSLKIFNLLGQQVAVIFEGYQTAGNYTATFNASGLSSGIYMYRMESGNVVLTKKLMMMK